jgi:hypothetical protein
MYDSRKRFGHCNRREKHHNSINSTKMPKLCSCFKANNDDRNKHKQIKKDSDVKSNSKKKLNYSLFLTGGSFHMYWYVKLFDLEGDDESGKTKIIEELVTSHDSFTLRRVVCFGFFDIFFSFLERKSWKRLKSNATFVIQWP